MSGEADGGPRVFIRRIETPAGAPWDQDRAARLDARHGAPLGATEVVHAMRRLDRWRPSAPGRFAVAYVRPADLGAERRITADIDGQIVTFGFGMAPSAAGLRSRALTFGLVALTLVLSGLSAAKAWSAREANETTLAQLEIDARRAGRLGERTVRQAADARLLARAGAGGGFADLAADLAWLGQARRPAATLRRIEWRDGVLTVASEGRDPPVVGAERPVEAVSGAAETSVWRIGAPPPPVVTRGVARPSVVSSAAERQASGRRP